MLMLVIRRKVERNQSYTVFMLPGYFKEWPTSDYEHQEILKVFKQDRPHDGIVNDFSEFGLSRLPGSLFEVENNPR
ncbi:MAG TPA: hypothetical protein DIV79_12095 [Opitutae bacterium]|nr:hypothetical protein [Opitutaceae bacterium]HCR30748.1 hypothetical protein [Opitutae bacterium]